MDIMDYLYFYESANGTSYFDISDKYSISQSSLSKSLKRLETELGVVLFDRSARPKKLTDSGIKLKRHLDEIIPLYTRMINDISNTMPELTYMVSPHSEAFSLGEFFEKLKLSDNGLKLIEIDPKTLRFSDSIVISKIKAGELSFAIMHDSVLLPTTFTKVKLCDDTLYAILPETNPLAEKSSVSCTDIKGEHILGGLSLLSLTDNLTYLTGVSFDIELSAINRSRAFAEIAAHDYIGLYYQSDIEIFKLEKYGLCARSISDVPVFPILLCYMPDSSFGPTIAKITRELLGFLAMRE